METSYRETGKNIEKLCVNKIKEVSQIDEKMSDICYFQSGILHLEV